MSSIIKNQLCVPVLLVVFNRPETTQRVFDEVRKAQPRKLYIAADGPRNEDDENRCLLVKEIFKNVDWPCEVKALYRDQNLGCKIAVSSAINWFFQNEEEGIILEDDCLPSQSFFEYCDNLLEKYRNDERVYLISGYNKQNIWRPSSADYFFSNLGGIWGWASWRRAWRHFDLEMKSLDEFISQKKFQHLLGKRLGNLRQTQMLAARGGKGMSAWDYQWGFARHFNSGMACVPTKSLIENIGFGEDATHTKINISAIRVCRHEIDFPLRENPIVVADADYDNKFFQPLYVRILGKMFTKLKGQ